MTYRINFKSILDYKHVENYLNNMASKSYELEDFSLFTFTFKKSKKMNFTYKVIYVDKDALVNQNDLTKLFEDSGWSLVNNRRYYKLDCLVFKSDNRLNLDGFSDLQSEKVMIKQVKSRMLTKWSIFFLLLDISILLDLTFFSLDTSLFGLRYLAIFIFFKSAFEKVNRIRLYFKYKEMLFNEMRYEV